MDLEATYLGLFLGCLMSATVIPFASEAIFLAVLYSSGDPFLTIVTATLGNFCGSLFTFFMGYLVDFHHLEKWFRIKQERVHSMKNYLDKYGVWAAALTWIPFIGDPLTLTLGFFRVHPLKVLVIILIVKWARYQLIYFIFF